MDELRIEESMKKFKVSQIIKGYAVFQQPYFIHDRQKIDHLFMCQSHVGVWWTASQAKPVQIGEEKCSQLRADCWVCEEFPKDNPKGMHIV